MNSNVAPSMSAQVRVVLVDDQALLRGALVKLVDAEPDLVVAGEAADGFEALDVITATAADVVLLDIRMPRLDGLEVARRVCADPDLSATRVVMLSMFEMDDYVYAALRAGASGFLLKDVPPEALVDAVRRVHAGECLLAPSILTRLVEHFTTTAGAPRATAATDHLTQREREVLILIGRGLTNDELADRLVISRATVKTHIAHLLDKLAARDRAQLVITTYESGLIRPRR